MNSARSLKRKSHDANLDELEISLAALGRETQPIEITDNKYILSSNAINSYMNHSSQYTGDSDNEQIILIQKAILEEKSCPNVLPFQTELYSNLSEIVENQVLNIKAFVYLLFRNKVLKMQNKLLKINCF